MPYLSQKNGQIYYRYRGQGQPILLLHGLERTSDSWGNLPFLLAKHYTVVTMDLRGCGQSSLQINWKDKISDLAADASSLMAHLKHKQYFVFGLSLGGMVAMELTRLEPDRILGSIVANSSAGGLGSHRLNPFAGLMTTWTHLLPELNTAVIALLCSAKSAKWKQKLELWNTMRRKIRRFGWERETTTKYLLAALNFRLPEYQVLPPTLIMFGTEDRLVSCENSEKIAATLRAQGHRESVFIAPCRGMGHELIFENPEGVVEKINQFIGYSLEAINRQQRAS